MQRVEGCSTKRLQVHNSERTMFQKTQLHLRVVTHSNTFTMDECMCTGFAAAIEKLSVSPKKKQTSLPHGRRLEPVISPTAQEANASRFHPSTTQGTFAAPAAPTVIMVLIPTPVLMLDVDWPPPPATSTVQWSFTGGTATLAGRASELCGLDA